MSEPNEKIKGWIYCITNPYFKDLCKIGKTKVSETARLLSASKETRTFIPARVSDSFELTYSIEVDDITDFEKKIHKHFNDKKENKEFIGSQEWYFVTPEEVKRYFDDHSGNNEKISIDYFRKFVIDNNVTLKNYNDIIPITLPSIYEINKGYFKGYNSFETIVGLTYDRRR